MSNLTVHPLTEKFPALAPEINRLYEEITASARTSPEQVIRIGELLREAKEEVKHGEWIPWLESNVTFDRRTASNYMRVYDRSKWEIISHLTLTEVYELLTIREQDSELANNPDPPEDPAVDTSPVPDHPVEIAVNSSIIALTGRRDAAQTLVEADEIDPEHGASKQIAPLAMPVINGDRISPKLNNSSHARNHSHIHLPLAAVNLRSATGFEAHMIS